MSKRYLLEIGVEEIPAQYIPSTKLQLREAFERLFRESDMEVESLRVETTPRRLVVLALGITSHTEDRFEIVKGPAKKIAYDENGNPTKALNGFLRSQGVTTQQVTIKELNGVEYVYAQKTLRAKDVDEVLISSVPEIIRKINFPKSMKWGGKSLRFARPIRWLVSILDDAVLPFELEGIPVSNVTRGHRFLGAKSIVIESIDTYEEQLKENYVILSSDQRRERIVRGMNRLAKEKGGNVLSDEDLLEEVANIVEYPTPLIGNIQEKYLSLPKEVIITPMKDHQRYFPVVKDNGQLLPYFITVRNGDEQGIDIVRKGNEKVLAARLEDAKFFYEEDLSKPLSAYKEDLKSITFQESLGTMYDKTNRLKKLSKLLGEKFEVSEDTLTTLSRAASLCKADLATKMVVEFTELQGVMGKIYAEKAKENSLVSNAIYEHYLPRFATDTLPTSTAGTVLSIADKIDTIVGLFAVAVKVTGSQDPYGLRRNALGIIHILIGNRMNIDLASVIKDALYVYVEEDGLVFDYDEVMQTTMDFFVNRLRNKFIDDGYRHDIINAVLATDSSDIYDLSLRLPVLAAWLENRENMEALDAFTRVENLTSAHPVSASVVPDLFQTSEEKDLYASVLESRAEEHLGRREYAEVLADLSAFTKPINDFLDNVMVMVEDVEIRENRLALLGTVSSLITQLFVSSEIVK